MTDEELIRMKPWLKELVHEVVQEEMKECLERQIETYSHFLEMYERMLERSEARIADTKNIIVQQADNNAKMVEAFGKSESRYQKTIDKLIKSLSSAKIYISNSGVKNEVN